MNALHKHFDRLRELLPEQAEELITQYRADAAQDSRQLVEAIIRDTGELVTIPDPRLVAPSDPAQASRLTRLAGLSRPETQPDDGVDRRELHKRLREQQEKENRS